jgi:hypothetical protein
MLMNYGIWAIISNAHTPFGWVTLTLITGGLVSLNEETSIIASPHYASDKMDPRRVASA